MFENLWVADQAGFPIQLTPRNQNGHAPWVVVQRVSIRDNIVRHAAGGVNLLGVDNLAPSQRTNHITIADNIFDDLTSATWGAGSHPFQIGDGPDAVIIDHNTIISTDSSILGLYGGTPSAPTPVTNSAYTNNMSRHNTYGIFGADMSAGLSSINVVPPGRHRQGERYWPAVRHPSIRPEIISRRRPPGRPASSTMRAATITCCRQRVQERRDRRRGSRREHRRGQCRGGHSDHR